MSYEYNAYETQDKRTVKQTHFLAGVRWCALVCVSSFEHVQNLLTDPTETNAFSE